MLMVGVAKCLLCEVICYCTGSMGPKLVCVIWNSGVSAVVRTFRNVRYITSVHQVFTIEGCLLSWVPLYS